MSDTQPLHIKREKLIGRLEEVHKEAEKAREEANDKAEEKRKSVLEAVGKLTDDQVANIIDHFTGYDGDDLVEWVEDKVDNQKFSTVKLEPSHIETVLERNIRILKLASDEEIQVRAGDNLYPYL